MKKWTTARFLSLLAVLCLTLFSVSAAFAGADRFVFTEQQQTLFEGETMMVSFDRQGKPAEEGTLTYKSSNERVATVSGDGTVTAISKGNANIVATLKVEKKTWKCTMKLTVARKVTEIRVNESKMNVLDPLDPAVSPLLGEETDYPVLILPIGKTLGVNAVCDPSDASDRRYQITSSDKNVVKVNGTNIKAVKAGECDVTVASRQLPDEVYVNYHVLVSQPVTRITLTAPRDTVAKGERMQLTPVFTPENATIHAATWKSGNENIVRVDQNGVVTGVARGYCYITATAADGSGKQATYKVTVTQPVEGVHMKYDTYTVDVDGSVTVRAEMEPSNANNTNMSWYSDDPGIAKVSGKTNAAKVTGVNWGTTTVTGVTEDGGYSTSATIKVGSYNSAVDIAALDIVDGKISIVLKNKSDMDMSVVNFFVTCYDPYGNPLPCSSGGSSSFYGTYQVYLPAGDYTQHGRFTFYDYYAPAGLGGLEIWITDYVTDDGWHYLIPEEKQPTAGITTMWFQQEPTGMDDEDLVG